MFVHLCVANDDSLAIVYNASIHCDVGADGVSLTSPPKPLW